MWLGYVRIAFVFTYLEYVWNMCHTPTFGICDFKYDDATEPAKNLKYVERYVSGTNPLTYFEYLVLTQSLSSQ